MMELTFTQAAKGINKEMSINIDAACQRCDGKGNEPGTKVQHCGHCNGSGMVSASTAQTSPTTRFMFVFFSSNVLILWYLQETVNTGPFVMRSTCRQCGGKGTIISSPCRSCRGSGQTKQKKTVMVPVPAGQSHNVKYVMQSVQTNAV